MICNINQKETILERVKNNDPSMKFIDATCFWNDDDFWEKLAKLMLDNIATLYIDAGKSNFP